MSTQKPLAKPLPEKHTLPTSPKEEKASGNDL